MPQNIFKIYDGRTSFWQWDVGQKLIVLDDSITEVHFSNRDMNHSIPKKVYEYDGKRVCDIPDVILQLPRNLVAYAYANGTTVKSVKFAVIKRPIPDGYVADQNNGLDEINARLERLEAMLKDVEAGIQSFKKFDSIEEASQWAKNEQISGIVVVVRIEEKWIAHVVEDNFTVTPICDCNGQQVEVNIFDGGDEDGYAEEELLEVKVWDGGNAAGFNFIK